MLIFRDKKSAAALAGLQAGDVVLEINGQKVENALDLIAKISSTAPEQSVSLTIIRETGENLERKTIPVKLAERPSNNKLPSDDNSRRTLPVENQREMPKPFGLTLTELTPTLAASYKVEAKNGLVVKNINPASYIADVKSSNGDEALREGDLIQRINRIPVTDLKSFNDIVGKMKKGDAVVLHVLSKDGQPRIVQFTVQ